MPPGSMLSLVTPSKTLPWVASTVPKTLMVDPLNVHPPPALEKTSPDWRVTTPGLVMFRVPPPQVVDELPIVRLPMPLIVDCCTKRLLVTVRGAFNVQVAPA